MKNHILIAIIGMITIYLGVAFVEANLNLFECSKDARSLTVGIYLFEQLFAQGIYSIIRYKI